jgi:hypothetical protein
MKYLLIFLTIIVSYQAVGQSVALPAWFNNAVKQEKLDVKYEIKAFVKPAYLRADFNGDNAEDIAVMVVDKQNHKRGILLI